VFDTGRDLKNHLEHVSSIRGIDMREFCCRHQLYAPHGLSDHRSEAFRQKMIRYFQYSAGNDGSKPWNTMKSIPQGSRKTGTVLEESA
jgi:hypothetical protein